MVMVQRQAWGEASPRALYESTLHQHYYTQYRYYTYLNTQQHNTLHADVQYVSTINTTCS